jgi:ribosome-binding protein aMBF1 (putative translation factor)
MEMETGRRRALRTKVPPELATLSPAEIRLREIKEALCALLRKERLARGISQAALAQRLDGHSPSISQIERGTATVGIDSILKALVALEVSNVRIGHAIAAVEPGRVSGAAQSGTVNGAGTPVARRGVPRRRIKVPSAGAG